MLQSQKWSAVVLCTIAPALCNLSVSQGQFIYANNLQGVNVVSGASATFGTGVSVCDFDGDGLDDISFGTKSTPPFLFRNTGSGFQQLPFTHPSPDKAIKSIIWVDVDNDGDRDLFLSYEFDSVRLYENIGNMELVDVTPQSGLLMETNIRNAGASFADYDNDGDLDLYLCKYYNSGAFAGPTYENILYRNNGGMSFQNVTFQANASVGVNASFNPVWWDYDSDGWVDLYIVNDRVFNQNYLLRNLGNGSFQDVSEATGVNHFIDAMGCALGDFNNDLLIDFYVANSEFVGNYLYQHLPDHSFAEVGLEAGVRMHKLCWSGLWLDYDNDGWQDLHVAAEINQIGQMAPNHLYRNLGDGTFENATQSAGLAFDHFSTFSTAGGDWNNDGYPDFVCSNAPPNTSLLWQNSGGDANYIGVTLEGTVSNRDAVGATIYAYSGDLQQVRYVTCSENHIAQNSFRKLFGLGDRQLVDSLVIKWPRGLNETHYNLDVNATHHFVEGETLSASIVAPQLFFCENDALTLTASLNHPVLWSTGEIATTISVSTPGSYWYSVELPNGFSLLSDTVSVVSTTLSTFQSIVNHPSCYGLNDGSIEITNALPDTSVAVVINGSPAELITPLLGAGTYSIEIVDQFGCISSSTVELTEPLPLQSLVLTDPILCSGDSTSAVPFTFGGTPPYTFDWNGINPQSIPAGDYALSITDANGCTHITEFSLTSPEPLDLEIALSDGWLTPSITGGTPPYVYLWTNPDGETSEDSSIEPLVTGEYVLIVHDSNGCSIESGAHAIVQSTHDLEVNQPFAFPNPANDQIHVGVGGQERITAVQVFDNTGRLVIDETFSPCQLRNITTSSLMPGTYTILLTTEYTAFRRSRFTIARN